MHDSATRRFIGFIAKQAWPSRRKGVMVEQQPLALRDAPNHTWSMDSLTISSP